MNKSIISVVLLGILIGLGILTWPLLTQNSEHRTAGLISNERPQGGNFTLMSDTGTVSLSDFKNKLVLLYFGYTFCPDICPTNLGNLSVAFHALSPEQKQKVQVLFVSIDPVRDTPERLKQYVNYFDMNAIGLTGDEKYLAKIAHQYGVVYMSHQKNPADQHYAVDHSAFTYVIDPTGKLQMQLPHATSPNDFIKTIQNYLE